MALTKDSVIDQITVTENGTILYREVTRIMEDGKPLSEIYHRTSIEKNGDLTNAPSSVKDIAQVAWKIK
jgi:hypothetical protein